MPNDQRGSTLIDEVECRTLLRLAGVSGEVGHLAINREGSPHIVPVNFSFFEETILVRLGPGYAAYHLDGATVTFEIDHAESYAKRGWSVEVTGTARIMTYQEVARLGRNLPHTMVMYPGMRVFSIRPETISGRAIRHDHQYANPPPSSWWPEREHEGASAYTPELPESHAASEITSNDDGINGERSMELHLDGEQVSELQNLLKQALGELSSEIADTDNPGFKRTLRERRHQLQTIELQLRSEDGD